MKADDVADYLNHHPEFFEHQADLLARITLPSPHGDAAVSLGERQVGVLRDKLRQMESKLAELISFGEENDAIAEKVHLLAVALIADGDFASLIRTVYSLLGGGFAVPHVALRLWGIGAGSAAEYSPVSDSVKRFADTLRQPYCGPAAGQEAGGWFGERSGHIRSLVQIPLVDTPGKSFGLLVLASEEAARFHAEMGVLYLTRIGDMTSAALRRVLG